MDTSYRVNDQIRISRVQVVDEEGEMKGEFATEDALRLARDSGLDLVEVAPNARPPVCRIMDYGKFKYEQKLKRKKNEKSHHQQQVKEIRLRPKTGDHDIEVKVKRARGFLEDRDKVKMTVIFRGRENAHHERGRSMLTEIAEQLDEIAKVEKLPGMESQRTMSIIFAPR